MLIKPIENKASFTIRIHQHKDNFLQILQQFGEQKNFQDSRFSYQEDLLEKIYATEYVYISTNNNQLLILMNDRVNAEDGAVAIEVSTDYLENIVAQYGAEIMQADSAIPIKKITLEMNENFTQLLNQLRKIVSNNESSSSIKNALLDIKMKELMLYIFESAAKNLVSFFLNQKSQANDFKRLSQYIQQNISEKLTMEKLSQFTYMSKTNFYRRFKKEFGVSPIEYIMRLRIAMAKNLLRNSEANIYAIGYQVGFNNASHFFKIFKRYEGLTPLQLKMM